MKFNYYRYTCIGLLQDNYVCDPRYPNIIQFITPWAVRLQYYKYCNWADYNTVYLFVD